MSNYIMSLEEFLDEKLFNKYSGDIIFKFAFIIVMLIISNFACGGCINESVDKELWKTAAIISEPFQCGNGVCDWFEDPIWCPADCANPADSSFVDPYNFDSLYFKSLIRESNIELNNCVYYQSSNTITCETNCSAQQCKDCLLSVENSGSGSGPTNKAEYTPASFFSKSKISSACGYVGSNQRYSMWFVYLSCSESSTGGVMGVRKG